MWRCPVTWRTVWKGTAQNCVGHMRRAHDIPPLVKVANLARWFPPWTVTREQWSSMTRPAVSGIAVDTLFFSCTDMLLFHWYRVFDRQDTHGPFRGTYMQLLRTVLEESDAALVRRHHRRCTREIPERLVGRTRGSGSLASRQPWAAHWWPRGLFDRIALRGVPFGL